VAQVSGQSIGSIDIYDEFTFVQVPQADVQKIVAALRQATLRGQRVNAEIARPRR